jgi:hypothetical protein
MTGTTLFISLVTGSIGAGFFIYGKKQQKVVPMLSGAGLCIVPYLLTNLLLLASVSVVLCLLPFLIRTD